MLSEERQILELFKARLKSLGMTYKDLARSLGLAEVTIKKMFSRGGLEFSRIVEICRRLDLELSEVVSSASTVSPSSYRLTEKEDEYFYQHPMDYGFLTYLSQTGSLAKTERELRLTRAQSLAYVFRLKKLGFVELLPGDKIRLLRSTMIEARPEGNLRKVQGLRTRTDFISGDFHGHALGAIEICQGEYSDESLMKLKLEILRLNTLAVQLHFRDERLPSHQKKTFGILGAMRGWRWKYLDDIKEMFRSKTARS